MRRSLPKKSIALALGLVVYLGAYSLSLEWEKDLVAQRLHQDSANLTANLKQDIERTVEHVVSISAFYAASNEVERDEFRAFVTRYLKADLDFLVYEWVPRVIRADRPAFEERVRQEGIADFGIKELDEKGQLRPAPEREEYYPVDFIEPTEGNQRAFGFDVASDSIRWLTMQKARDSGLPAATPSVYLVQKNSREIGQLIFIPIYRNGMPSDTLEERRRNLQGYAGVLLSVDRFISAAMRESGLTGVDVRIYEYVEGKKSVLYSSQSEDHDPLETRGLPLGYETELSLAGQRWTLSCRPTPYYSRKVTDNPISRLRGLLAALLGILAGITVWAFLNVGSRRGPSAGHSEGLLAKIGRALRTALRWSLKPPVWLMSRLSYTRKFMVISVLFILPLVLATRLLVTELKSRIDFSQKELYGTQYLRPLHDMLVLALDARVATYLYTKGDVASHPRLVRLRSEIKNKIDELGGVDAQYHDILGTAGRQQILAYNLRFLQEVDQISVMHSYGELFDSFLEDVQAFISHVGDASNLILDPDLDTYYLMDAVLLKLPQMQRTLGDARLLAEKLRDSTQEERNTDEMYSVLLAGLKAEARELNKGLGIAEKNNPAGNLVLALEKSRVNLEIALSAVTEKEGVAAEPQLHAASEAADALWQTCTDNLDILLERRIEIYLHRTSWVLTVCIVMLFLALYVWTAFYLSFMRTVRALESASNRMVEGGEFEATRMDTKDELGRVVESFNKVALQLRRERDAAKEDEERFRIVAESTSNLIYEWHIPTGRVDWIGKVDEYFGYAPGGFPRTLKAREELLHPDDRPRIHAAIERHFRTREPFFEEYRIRKPNGEIAIWADGGTALWKGNAKPEKWVGAVSDVTNRRQLETQLLQSQKMETVGNLAGGIAHDLNNQLTPIRGYMDLILSEFDPKDPLYPQLAEIQHAAKRCSEIVQGLLDFSRPSSRKKSGIELAHVLKELKATFPKFLPSTIETTLLLDEKKLGRVWANETELQMVFMNFVANARDAMPKGGQLAIEAYGVELSAEKIKKGFPPGRYACVTFRDSGTGMSEETAARIFEPFFSTKEKGKGTGLGLSMVFNLVKDHGGWVEVSSKLGAGTTFQVFLPSYAGEQVSAEKEVEEGIPAGAETLLLADDEEALRKMGKSILERLGYKVILASNGLEAVEVFRSLHTEIDATILDMTMPKLTGLETIKRLLEIDPKARIILASGFTSEGSAEDLIKAGARDYIKKPYSIAVLAQTLRRTLDAPK